MPEIRNAHQKPWRGIVIVGLSGIAAFVASRAAARSATEHLAHIDTAIAQLALYARRDYWSVYRQVQNDLLAGEEPN